MSIREVLIYLGMGISLTFGLLTYGASNYFPIESGKNLHEDIREVRQDVKTILIILQEK